MVLNQNYVVKTLHLKTNEKTGPGTTFLSYQSVKLPSSSIKKKWSFGESCDLD